MTERMFFTTAQAAEATGLSVSTIEGYLRSGALKAKRSGRDPDGNPAGRYVITRQALMDWFESLEDA